MSKAKERLDPWSPDIDKIQSFLHIQRYEYAMKEVKGLVLDVGCGLRYGSLCKKFKDVIDSLKVTDND